ncbi:uncharacterized protein LOC127735740 [Mytilus californianus]|uniref:uncharacterized protein LOC127735740 n=1 Tax=Mytilus californianus TaxID=6549 RepID=UPI00224848E0|nr:uncharacterized protein LOC127735740 [Mytilus californianus]
MFSNKRNAIPGTITRSSGNSFFDDEDDDGVVISELQNSSRPFNLYSALESFGDTITEENEDSFDDPCSPQIHTPINNDKDKSTLENSITKKIENLRLTAKSDNANVKSVKRFSYKENSEIRKGRKNNHTRMHNSDKSIIHQDLSCVKRRSSLKDVTQMFPCGCDEHSTNTETKSNMDFKEFNRCVQFDNSVLKDSQYMKRRSSFSEISQMIASNKNDNIKDIRVKSSHVDKSWIDRDGRFSELNKQSMGKDVKQTKRRSSLDDLNKVSSTFPSEKYTSDNKKLEIKDNVIFQFYQSDGIDSNDIISIPQKSATKAALRSTKSAINMREFLISSKIHIVSSEKRMLNCSEGQTIIDKVAMTAAAHDSGGAIKDDNALQRKKNENKVDKSVHLISDSSVIKNAEFKTGTGNSDIQNNDLNSFENNSVQTKPWEWLAKSKIRQSKREHHMISPACF